MARFATEVHDKDHCYRTGCDFRSGIARRRCYDRRWCLACVLGSTCCYRNRTSANPSYCRLGHCCCSGSCYRRIPHLQALGSNLYMVPQYVVCYVEVDRSRLAARLEDDQRRLDQDQESLQHDHEVDLYQLRQVVADSWTSSPGCLEQYLVSDYEHLHSCLESDYRVYEDCTGSYRSYAQDHMGSDSAHLQVWLGCYRRHLPRCLGYHSSWFQGLVGSHHGCHEGCLGVDSGNHEDCLGYDRCHVQYLPRRYDWSLAYSA